MLHTSYGRDRDRSGLTVLLAAIATTLAVVWSPAVGQPAYQRLPWASTQGPPGGLGYDIRYNFGDPSVWYVTDAWSGVHRSTDRGISWSPSNDGISIGWGPAGDTIPIFSLTVDPHDPTIVWAGTQNTGQIFKSTDGGIHWTELSQGIDPNLVPHLSFRGFTVDPTESDTVYSMGEIGSPGWNAGQERHGLLTDMTKGIVYRTVDGGLGWTEIHREDNLARYCWIDPRDRDVLYVSTGIFDREAANTDVANEFPGGVGILKSTDRGQWWGVIDETNGLTDRFISSLYMNPADPQVLIAAGANDLWSNRGPEHTGGVFRTSDGGAFWDPVLAGEFFSVVEFCPSHPDIAYAGSYKAMYRSDDAGLTWQRFNRPDGTWGSPGLVAGYPIDVQCDPADPMRVAVNNYLGGNFLSRNGGQTWLSASRGYSGALVRSVAVAPTRGSTVFAGSRSGVFRSEDGGDHWVGTQYPPPELIRPDAPVKLTEIAAVAIDPADASHILASTFESDNILVSEDDGRSWHLASLPTGTRAPVSLAFAPADSRVVYAGSAKYARCKDQSSADPGECNVPGSGVFISEDGGETWLRSAGSDLDDKAVLTVEPHPTDPNTVLAGTHSVGLHRSQDRGASWSPVGVGLPSLPVLDLAIHPQQPALVFAAVQGAAIYKSVDGGDTFVQSSAGLEPNAFAYSVVVDPNDTDVVYMADRASGVYVSTNAGSTWQAINQGLEHKAARSLALTQDGSVLYVGVKGAGVWRLGAPAQEPAFHDTCDQAVEIGTGTYAEQFSNAGIDGGASCASPPGADLWYRHTPTANGTLHVSTCGTHDVGVIDAGIDTVVSIHTGCPGTPGNEFPGGCSDDWTSGSDPSACTLLDTDTPADGAVAVSVQAGNEVWIRVGRRQPPAAQGEFWLTVQPDYPSAGYVPDGAATGGEPLRLEKTLAGTLLLSWGNSCRPSDVDYSVYRGALGDYSNRQPETCSTGQANSWETALTGGDTYYLVVPHNGLNEGSYGFTRPAGQPPVDRIPSASACRPQVLGECPQPLAG